MKRIAVPGLIPKRRRIPAGTTSCPFVVTTAENDGMVAIVQKVLHRQKSKSIWYPGSDTGHRKAAREERHTLAPEEPGDRMAILPRVSRSKAILLTDAMLRVSCPEEACQPKHHPYVP